MARFTSFEIVERSQLSVIFKLAVPDIAFSESYLFEGRGRVPGMPPPARTTVEFSRNELSSRIHALIDSKWDCSLEKEAMRQLEKREEAAKKARRIRAL